MHQVPPAHKPPKPSQSKFQKHLIVLIWKSYIQRQRRWRLLVAETVFAAAAFIIAIFIALPVFLTPVQDEPVPRTSFTTILSGLPAETIIGFAPAQAPYKQIMERAAALLGVEIMEAESNTELDMKLYDRAKGRAILNKVIWVLWLPNKGNVYRFKIRSTESKYKGENSSRRKQHTHTIRNRPGFLAVQLSVCHAILESAAPEPPNYELGLVAMPVSPLMDQELVRRAISLILICYTLALLPPVLETEYLVVTETVKRLKRALRVRGVDYSTMYIGWLVYALLTAIPICTMGSISLILIFRWIHLFVAMLTLLAYFCVMMMLALIMSMFHKTARVTCFWSTVQTLLQTFLAELIVHHELDRWNDVLTFIIKTILPPLGLLNGLNEFALLQTGRASVSSSRSNEWTILSWSLLMFTYFLVLMLLQHTIGSERAIGGQVSWKTIIFKKVVDEKKPHPVHNPYGERDKLQEVDELVAKAISFRNVSKEIMGVPYLTDVTFDIYRGEVSFILAARVQERMLTTVEDLLTGLTYPENGTINIMGVEMSPHRNLVTEPLMVGFCDNSSFLIEDLTVEEHLLFFIQICVWNETNATMTKYTHIRTMRLLAECDLKEVRATRVERLGFYYRAQLCWAIAMLLEPRIIIVPSYQEDPRFVAIIKDKIMTFKKYVTIVKLCLSSIELEFADRLFVLDNRKLAFGGTPAYMFYKFGREYRVRLNFRSSDVIQKEKINELLKMVQNVNASVRAYLGSLLILRIPTSPSNNVAKLVQHLEEHSSSYGIVAMNISLPDPEEVFKRAIAESTPIEAINPISDRISHEALDKIAAGHIWQKKENPFMTLMQLRTIGWKYFTYYIHFRFILILTVLSALVAGAVIGTSLAFVLENMAFDDKAKQTILGKILTVEAMNMKTTLVLRVGSSPAARAVGRAYVLTHPGADKETAQKMSYTAIESTQSLTEYLVTRAIDSPLQYVSLHTYGIDINTDSTGTLTVHAIYSSLHFDHVASARSLARAYMALLRYYTKQDDASIEIYDAPLALDVTAMVDSTEPAMVIQILLVFTISHMVLVPSHEHGLIRHFQKHASNFSPARYWISLAFCDLILYCMLAILMSGVALAIMFIFASHANFHCAELLSITIMLMVYGMGCLPQAYLFSLGPRPTLNSMALIIVNIVFGEATIIAKLFYGTAYNFALSIMILSPQYNMAYAFVKIRQIFLYNCECSIVQKNKLCESKILHKCCSKCGVLQPCYVRKAYFTNIVNELIATFVPAVLFMSILMLWEYRIIQLIWSKLTPYRPHYTPEAIMPGARREKQDVWEKTNQLMLNKHYQKVKNDTFGEYLLAVNVSREEENVFVVENVCLGVGRGEALAIAGLRRHGRVTLIEMLAGYKPYHDGSIWAMSKYTHKMNPHRFCKYISLCGTRDSLPTWMTVYDGLEMIALLRGVPAEVVHEEIENYINAIDLRHQANLLICRLRVHEHRRLHFAAAVVGAPPILILDECTAYQTYAVRRAMYQILYILRKQGHAIVHSAVNVEAHMPVSNRLAIIRDGVIYDVDYVENLLGRYSDRGYTVVVHLKDEVDTRTLFSPYFRHFNVNDASDVLVNVQILDDDLTWASVFEKMEQLQSSSQQVYKYIVCAKPIDYIYNAIVSAERGYKPTTFISRSFLAKCFSPKPKIDPPRDKIKNLKTFQRKYALTSLKELPWSVIFQEN